MVGSMISQLSDIKAQLIDWNGYETPLLYVFVGLTVHNVQ